MKQDKVAVVTGASQGIGYAIATELASLGYSLGLIARTKADIEKTSRDIQKKYPDVKVIYSAFDIVDGAKADNFIRRVCTELGSISVLINNAGYYRSGTSSVPMDEVQRLIDVNFFAAVRFVQAVLPSMKKLGRGYIFNIASLAGVETFAEVGSYSGSKFALVGYSKSLSQELAQLGIKVTVLCPSWVNTKNSKDAPMKPEQMIQVEDIALTVRYLLSLGSSALVREIIIRC
jgi:short-subunit dehydrogenase